MANGVAIRDWLKQQGYTDKDIGWQNGQVTLKGKGFYKPESVTGGRSYGSADALKRAIDRLNAPGKLSVEATPPATGGLDTQSKPPGETTSLGTASPSGYSVFGGATPPAGTVPIRDYLVGKGYGNKGIGWQNDLVTLDENVAIKPTSVIEGRSYAPAGTIESALKASGFKTPEQARIDALARRYEELVDKPLEYNPETDPRYQAARQLAEAEAGQASRRAMEELNARGILNSTITSDRLAQIQQQAAQGTASMIPGLYQAAQQERQSELANISGLLGTLSGLGQQEFTRGAQEAGITGYFGGVPTMEREALDRERLTSDRNYRSQAIKNYLDTISTFGIAPSAEYLPPELAWAAGMKTGAARQFDAELEQTAKDRAAARGVDWARLTQDQKQFEKQQAFKETQFTQETGQLEATNKAISDVLTAPTQEDAYNVLNESIRRGDFTGADLPAVIKAIESRYGTSSDTLMQYLQGNK